jgi:hypothetical protein
MSSQQTIKYLFSIVVLMKYERQALSNIYGTIALFPFFQKKDRIAIQRPPELSIFAKNGLGCNKWPKAHDQHMQNYRVTPLLPRSFLSRSLASQHLPPWPHKSIATDPLLELRAHSS